MTYHSDTLAFKKSELLEVLQAINSNFSFEDNDSSKQNNTANSKHENIIEYVPNHLKVLALSDYFSIVEAACFISQDEPAKIQALLDSGDLNYDAWHYGEHIQAVKVIENGIKASKLEIDSEGQILRRSLQYFLHERGYILSGFNDKLPEQELIGCGTPSIKQTSPNNQEIEQLKVELIQAQERIKELELQQETKERLSTLQTLIEESKKDSKIREQQEKISHFGEIIDQQVKEIANLKQRLFGVEALREKFKIPETPEQEVPNSRQRNNVLKIINILSQMANLPPEPFTAFNMLEAYAAQNNKELPSKHTVADWIKKARDSN